MKNLLKFEFRKLFRQTSLYVCSCILIGYIITALYISKDIAEAWYSSEELSAMSAITELPQALSSGPLIYILGIFIALFLCVDNTDGTLKNIYGKGYSRTQSYFSKLTAVIAASVIFCLVCWFGTYAAASCLFGTGTGFNAALITQLLAQLVTVLAYSCIFIFIAVLFRKNGVAIASVIVAPIAFEIGFILTARLTDNKNIYDYWLGEVFSTLSSAEISSGTLGSGVFISLIYIVIFTTAGAAINSRQEV